MNAESTLTTERLASLLESLIFVAEQPLSREVCRAYISKFVEHRIESDRIDEAIDLLLVRHHAASSGIRLEEIAEGLQFLSAPSNFELIKLYLKEVNKKRLSKTALETLAIVAYKQPVTKTDIEHIRGVSADYILQKLLEKELIEITGRAETPGRPLLYETTRKFLDHFGLKDIKALPQMKEFATTENTVGLAEEE